MDTCIASSIKYGYLKTFKEAAIQYAEIVDELGDKFYNFLDLPRNIKVNFKPIRSQHIVGLYDSESKHAIIDIRTLSLTETLTTICHELVHAEQYHQGLLYSTDTNFFWRGKKWPARYGTSLTNYYNLPWEQDAYKRQDILFKKIFKKHLINNEPQYNKTTQH